jgi:hypothetical protein
METSHASQSTAARIAGRSIAGRVVRHRSRERSPERDAAPTASSDHEAAVLPIPSHRAVVSLSASVDGRVEVAAFGAGEVGAADCAAAVAVARKNATIATVSLMARRAPRAMPAPLRGHGDSLPQSVRRAARCSISVRVQWIPVYRRCRSSRFKPSDEPLLACASRRFIGWPSNARRPDRDVGVVRETSRAKRQLATGATCTAHRPMNPRRTFVLGLLGAAATAR